MVGLVYVKLLELSPTQWSVIMLQSAGWLWQYRAMSQKQDEKSFAWWRSSLLLLSLLWSAFWGTFTCVDHWLLFWQAGEVSPLSWSACLAELAERPYVKYQSPLLTFYWSRLPLLWLHQLLMFPYALLCFGLLFALYCRNAALLCATPVFALMIHQPCHDTILLLVVLRLLQLEQRGWAATVYGLTYAVKPLALLTLPFLLPRLGGMALVSLAMWGGYIGWSLSYEFGRQQTAYLLHLLLIGSKKAADAGDVGGVFTTLAERPDRIGHNLAFRLNQRWTRIGSRALPALPFYLFPVYLRPISWQGVCLILLILFGFGNIKYLLLPLLFFFPVHYDDDDV